MIFHTSAYCKKDFSKSGGFGLIELLVSISIMVLVTTIVLANHSAFNTGALLRSQAYEIALQLREVQLAAVGIQSGDGVQFNATYGLAFFVDVPNLYRPYIRRSGARTSEDFGPRRFLDKRFEITCLQAGSDLGSLGGCFSPGESLSVAFRRPNFDAFFFNRTQGELPQSVSVVVISIGQAGAVAGTGSEWQVVVTRAGQISVQPRP